MKISPVSSPINPPTAEKAATDQVSPYKLKMRTNYTPLGSGMMPMAAEPENSHLLNENKEPIATEEATQPLSPQLALLAKQRRALQVKERELRQREQALKEQGTGNPGIPVDRLKSETLSVLLENGITYDQLTEAILNNQGNHEVNALKTKLASLEESIDKKFLEKDQLAERQVLAEMRREAEHLASMSDEYELVRETGSIPQVMELIERTYKEKNVILDVPEALKLMEEQLLEDAKKLAMIRKVQGQINPMPQIQPQLQQPQQGMRTLTNKHTAPVLMDRRARALAAALGQPIRR